MTNALYYGDNLVVLRDHIPDESVDLVYLDPPFNSNASYNVLFKEQSGEASPAQIQAFTDTWEWTLEAERTYEREIMLNPATPVNVKEMISAFRQFIGSNAMMAYLVMMAPRLVELRRVLKPTGSIYLHCDPTASHYLKVLMDAVFGQENFRSEVVWKRSHAHSSAKRYGPIHDTLLYYSKTGNYVWTDQRQPYDSSYIERYFKFDDGDGRGVYWSGDLTGSGTRRGETGNEWRGFNPTTKGRHWMYPPLVLDRLDSENRIFWPKGQGAWPKLKRYLAEAKGIPLQDIVDDVYSLQTMGGAKGERLGYPTQKPQALLERIILASSNPGDVVLDPFCGCGTAVAAAHKLDRHWSGIDVTHLAVALMKNRLKTAFDLLPGRDYRVVGEPADVGSARALAEQDRYQFQFWAMSLLEAQPREQGKKGADRGIDGVVYFVDGPRRTMQKAIVQVKSGRVSSPHVRDLKGAMEREKAALGLFITLEEPTRDMLTEAASAGFYRSDVWQRDYPRVQIRTVGELLAGVEFEVPRHPSMYQAAQRERPAEGEQRTLMETPAVYKPDHERFAELRDEIFGDRTLPGNSADLIREARAIRDAEMEGWA